MTEENNVQPMAPEVITDNQMPSLASEMANVNADILNTVQGDDPISKAKVFNALTNPTGALSDLIGQTIYLVDVVGQYVEMVDDKTGEVNNAPRMVLLDKDGNSYACVSTGIKNSLEQIFAFIGTPHYDIPLPLKVLQKKSSRNAAFHFLTLEIDVAEYQKLYADKK